MTMNTSYRKLFSRSTAAGLALLLVLVNLPVAEAGLWVKRDWSRVQAVAPGTRTTVVLYKDQAPVGKRQIEGHFRSATAESIALLLPNGRKQTLRKQTVRKVLVYRPLKKRYQGWITAAVGTAVWASWVANPESDLKASAIPLLAGVLIGAPTALAFLVAPKMGDIYNVPPQRRDPSSTGTKPPKQHPSTKVPGVTEAGGGLTGSGLVDNFLTEPSGPDLLRHRARQALVRKGLPLHLPDLSVRLSAEALAQAGDTQTGLDRSFPRVDGVSRTDNLD